MFVYAIYKNKLKKVSLPEKVDGNFWIDDINEYNDKFNLITIEAQDGRWKLIAHYNYELYKDNQKVDFVYIENYNYYFLKNNQTKEVITLYICPINEVFHYYHVKAKEISIGTDSHNSIFYNNSMVANKQVLLSYRQNGWLIKNFNPGFSVFLNENVVKEDTFVNYGDVIFIMGLKIIPINNFFIMCYDGDAIRYNQNEIEPFENNITSNLEKIEDDDEYMLVYKANEYFRRAPRFRSKVETLKLKIENPPEKRNGDEMPTILAVGPMMTMSIISVVLIYNSITKLATGGTAEGISQLVMGVAMFCAMLIWPLITRRWRNKYTDRQEIKRRDRYEKYIQRKRNEITNNISKQRQILLENYLSSEECSNIILNRRPKLWERKLEDDDFLMVRLGQGKMPLDISLDYPDNEFKVDDDILNDIIRDLVSESKDINGAPITISFLEKQITGIIGPSVLINYFLKGILLQLITYYSGDILKIVFLNKNSKDYYCFRILKHCWNEDETFRFFATNSDEIKEVLSYLDKQYDLRFEDLSEGLRKEIKNDSYKKYKPYYLIITDDYENIAENKFTKSLLEDEGNLGFSMIILNDKLATLPSACSGFINIGEQNSGLIENELVTTKQRGFLADFPTNIDINKCCVKLANIPMIINSSTKSLPNTYGFLQMYNVGKVEQLNALSRWKQNDPTVSLSVPIGINPNGDLFKIDLHEKYHGPHGLVAGTTGSGKSEWIITFVLSMAINYHPDEVSFVLIDYKGGGLALAFENKELGIKLPHIAGTITNLDVTELNRSLASIEAELKRRQREFNKARDISGESTIDIYKYQRLYREGVVDKPISHLFIISDEFAELKAQQPDFMDQLVSTARIGRSLGVHLILATQKPTGVVNDQIASNSRFKVCLKVQDKSDSTDMIRVPDAAEIKQAGRFYLLVGYNDYFAVGQSAYCGMPYEPSDIIRKPVDTNITFVNNIGRVIKNIDDIKIKTNTKNYGEVLLNIVKYLANVANKEQIKVNQLWLDRIPNIIYVNDLIKKYNYSKVDFEINPVIGEYDDPANQSQHLLTVPLSKVGNALVYGMAGSGKEEFLTTLIYSSIITYSVEELNIYAIDCGSETLKMFKSAPQVGDILIASDEDKIKNLFKMIEDILEYRKKLLAQFGGSFSYYNKVNENKLANILIVLNNYDSFQENYESYEEELVNLTRDCVKYGITFVISGATSASIRSKLKNNFTQNFVLQLTDPYEYLNILGSVNKMVPSNNKGRGLIKFKDPYEFQTASFCEEEKQLEFISELCNKLKEKFKIKAKSVPTLPEVVTVNNLGSIESLRNLPIGIRKDTLEPITFDFVTNYVSVITSSSIDNAKSFINGLIQLIKKANNKIVIFDLYKLVFSKSDADIIYCDHDFDKQISSLNKYLSSLLTIYNKNFDVSSLKTCEDTSIMIIGLSELFERISTENQQSFLSLIKKAKVLGKIKIMLIDNIANIKKYSYEDWYRENVKTNSGIWIGSGISEQNIIRIPKMTKEMYNLIANDFGFVVIDGVGYLTKMVQYSEEIENLDVGDV